VTKMRKACPGSHPSAWAPNRGLQIGYMK
jgi:hypothetical protein